MGLSLWIAPESQYGALRLQDARQGARRRALVEGIQRSLFQTQDEPASETPRGPEFASVLAAFSGSAGQLDFSQPTTRRIWGNLIEPPRGDIDGGETHPTGPTFDAVFCMAIHGLCRALAVYPLLADALDQGEVEVEAGDPAEADDAGFVPEGADPGLWVAESLAQGSVADLIVKSLPRVLREVDQAELQTSALLIAAGLLDCLIAALGDWFERRQDKPRQPRYIVARTPQLARRMDRLLVALPYFFTPQPLKAPVVYRLADAGPADTDDQDYFRVDLIGYRRTNRFLRDFHTSAVAPERVAPKFQAYLDAVNGQQAVAWRINRPLHALALRLVGIAGDPGVREAEARQAGLTPVAMEELRAWIVREFYQPKQDSRARLRYQRSGEILDHPLIRSALEELCALGADGNQARFFLPWKADYRGRIYAETPWLTPQGGDLQRALFEFAAGSPLDDGGVAALRRHGANLVQRRRILPDLGIVGRQVLTLEERERWVREHEADILASAESPIAEPFWREAAD